MATAPSSTPRVVRRPVDRARFLFDVAVVAALLGGAVLVRAAPGLLIGPIVFASGVVMALAPIAAATERLLRREGRLVTDGVLAALITYLAAFGINLLVLGPGPEALREAVAEVPGTGREVAPLHLYIACVVAFITLVGFGDRLWLRNAAWTGLVVTAAAALAGHDATLIGVVASFALGRAVAFGVRWLRGSVELRPTDADIEGALAEEGYGPGDLDVVVLDRDRATAGLGYRLYQWLRVRRAARSEGFLGSLQAAVEQRTLLSLAVRDSGIRTPRLLLVRKLSPDAVLLGYEHPDARPLTEEEGEGEAPTDELLHKIWETVAELHRHHISHRRLSAGAFLVGEDGAVWVTRLEAGSVAAADLQLLLDDAELLLTSAMLTDPVRAVAAARAAIGDERLAALKPLLRPAVFSHETRTELRKHKGLLDEIGKQVDELAPAAPEPRAALKGAAIERLRPRTILSGLGGAIAVYFLIGQFAGRSLASMFTGMSWQWALLALAATAVTYVAAAMGIAGFVAQRLPAVRVLLTQLAASFISLVTPGAVGSIAINTRFLQRAGVPAGVAVTSMAVSQVVALLAFVLLLMLLGSISGSSHGTGLPPSSVIITVLLVVAVIAVVVAAVPRLRRFVTEKVRPWFAGVVPAMLELLRKPWRLAVGVGGAFLLPLAGSLALWASVRAFEHDRPVSFATVAVVYLIGKSAGSVVPTPGGLGAVEAVLSGGLAAATGVSGATAFSAVMLFRLLTFWLPILPGWVATTWLQRRNAV
ncbi:lysylphosphatidylglycerol synthase domain-containing protein [Streptomyces boninensis]|uniref:lysylphosphatidylglycerol synthase domain-containing protein n=1 Tax=Streptomyces boninensis TaxID=2039455 RepID=UPI003B221DB1